MAAFFNLPGTVNTTAIGINQNRYNPFGVIRMLTFGTVVAFYGMGIELLKKIGIEMTFMIFREQIKKYELEKTGVDEILLDWL